MRLERLRMRNPLFALTVLAVLILAMEVMCLPRSCASEYLHTEFSSPKLPDGCRARVSTDDLWFGVSQQLDLARKDSTSVSARWFITHRIDLEGLRCPDSLKYITLASGKGPLSALFVEGSGDTRRLIYIVAVSTTGGDPYAPKLWVLLDTIHEGRNAKLHYGLKGDLQAITLEFTAMHVVSDDRFPGHIILAQKLKWVPGKRKFAEGPLYADVETEQRLTWLEAMNYPGSERLGVSWKYDERKKQTIYRFRPHGILMNNLPADLKRASIIEVVTDSSGLISARDVSPATK